MGFLAGCSSVLGIEDPRPAVDGGLPQDGMVQDGMAQDGMPMQRCTPVINELMTGGMSGTTSLPADEWIELYNGCPDPVDITNWTLVYRAATATGSTDSTLLVTLQGSMAPRAFRLYAGYQYTGPLDGTWTDTNANGLIGQRDGAVGLRDNNRVLVDSLAYGAVMTGHPFIETKPIAAMSNGMSASRLPLDGNDTNNNFVDFQIIAAGTPGASNVL
jgi:5'-nucleotidase